MTTQTESQLQAIRNKPTWIKNMMMALARDIDGKVIGVEARMLFLSEDIAALPDFLQEQAVAIMQRRADGEDVSK